VPRAGVLRGCPGPLSQLETFVTFCGMVWVRAKVLGRLGRKPSPHPGACALSCPSLAVYGPGSLGHLTRPYFVAAMMQTHRGANTMGVVLPLRPVPIP
jgi:hypothetical protein